MTAAVNVIVSSASASPGTPTEKRKQKPKAGKVIRISDEAWSFIAPSDPTETVIDSVNALICEVIDLRARLEMIESAPSYAILPETKLVCSDIAEARGLAIVHAVRRGSADRIETPIEVREVV